MKLFFIKPLKSTVVSRCVVYLLIGALFATLGFFRIVYNSAEGTQVMTKPYWSLSYTLVDAQNPSDVLGARRQYLVTP